jgi:hypothetical protein
MKKTILIASVISIFLVSSIASASSLKDVVPATTQGYFEFNTSAENPLKSLILNELPQQFANSVLLNSPEDQKQHASIVKAFKDIITDNTLSLGMSLPEDFEVGTKITDIQYQNFIDSLGSEATIVSENPKIYVTREDFFFTKSNDLFLASQTKERLIDILKDTSANLTSNSEFKDISSDFSEDDNFKVYISSSIFDSFLEKEKDNSEGSKIAGDILSAFKAFGLTLKKTSTGLNSKIIISFNPAKAKEFGFLTTNSFTPLLYKSMPSENPIFYTEFSNLKGSLTSSLDALSKSGKFDSAELKIPEEVNTYLSLLEKEIAIYVQKDSQVLPAITIVFNTSAHKQTATDIITLLTTVIENEFNSQNVQYQKSTNKDLTTYTFDLNTFDQESKIPEGMNKLSFTFGTTKEGYLLFSTYSDIVSKYGEGLKIANINQKLDGIFYANMQNLASWYDQLLNTVSQTTSDEFTKNQIAKSRELLKEAKKPWKDISVINKNTASKSTTEINLNFDINALNTEYFETVDDFFKSSRKAMNSFKTSRQTFNDTPSSEWYYSDVRELNSRGVIKGYEDKSFKPGKEITRAEFLTMILRGFDDNNFEKNYANAASNFKDVNSDDWFSSAVAKGVNDGLIKGYGDNSFHPNSPITRAEATAMLNNAIKFKYGENPSLTTRDFSANQFSDVKEGDWSYEEVKKLYSYSIVDGDSNGRTFSPNRNLNRAEASKIINKALKELEK